MKRFYLLCLSLFIVMACSASILDMGVPSKLFTVGVRFGVNTSNRTVDDNVFNEWSNSAWGNGIDVGVTADLNLRNFISLQPGFFFESRSGNYAYVSSPYEDSDPEHILSQFGHTRSYNFTIPVMVMVRFNLAPTVRWNVGVGPYVQLIIKNSLSDGLKFPGSDAYTANEYRDARPSKFDFGFKFGTSLTFFRHFDLGVYYLAGSMDAWKNDLGGRNKAWVFTAGFDF